VNSQYFKGGETPASHRRTTYRGSTCLAGQVVMTPASSLHVQTAPRPLFHGGGLRGSEMGTAATHSLSEPARSGNRVSGADGREGHGGEVCKGVDQRERQEELQGEAGGGGLRGAGGAAKR
jgi:hypothetical protein